MKITFTQMKRWGIALSLAALGLGATDANAQLAANTYQFSAINGTFTEITGATALASIQSDDVLSAAIPIGFTFNYCGTDYTQAKVSSNGWLSFNLTTTSSAAGNDASSFNTIKPAIYPLWEDLSGSGGTAGYVTTGTAPNRIFTMEFKNWKWNYSGTAAAISFQIKLYEGSNLIQYVYRQESGAINTASGGASIGIVDNNATAGYLCINNTSTAPVASSTTFTINLLTKPANGQIYQFKPLPAIDMDADSIVVATPFCSNASQPVSARIKNMGTATINTVDIQWSVDGVLQTPVTYNTTPISNVTTAPNNRVIVPLGDVFFPDGNPRSIKAWTYQPNGMADEVPLNDSVTQPITAGLPGVIVHISPRDTTICQGTTITLDAGSFPNNPIYIWSNGNITQTLTTGQPGQYSVKVQNTMGCFDRDTISVSVHPNPLVNSIAIIDNGGNTFTFNAIGAQHIGNWAWDFDDGSAPATGTGLPVLQQVHHFTAAGEYNVKLTLSNDCNEIVTTRLVKIDAPPTGIDNLSELQKELRLYPNPGKGVVTVSSYNGSLKLNEVAVYNLMGQLVYQSAIKSGKHELDVSSMAAGIYNVIIATDKGKVTKKLEVVK